MKHTPKQNAALVEFLTEFAKLMISSGVSLVEFQAAAKTAFLQAAMGRARLRNFRVNQSALAAITGLNRAQVRELLNEWEEGPVPQPSRLFEVLDAWQRDSQFRAENLPALSLPIRGNDRSFSSLVKKYCGDVSHKAILTELKKLGYVRIVGKNVEMTPKGKSHVEPQEMRQLSAGLAFAIRNEASQESDMNVVTAEAIYKTPSPKSRLLIKKRLLQSTKAFAAEIKAAGEAEASKASACSDKRTRSSVLVITVDQGD